MGIFCKIINIHFLRLNLYSICLVKLKNIFFINLPRKFSSHMSPILQINMKTTFMSEITLFVYNKSQKEKNNALRINLEDKLEGHCFQKTTSYIL